MIEINEHKKVVLISLATLISFYGIAITSGIALAQKALMPTFVISIFLLAIGSKRKSSENMIFYVLILLPIINFTKGGFFSYNVLTIILAFYIFYLIIKEPRFFTGQGTEMNMFYLFFGISILYYLISVVNVGKYDSNLRVFELFFTSILLSRLYQNKGLFNFFIITLAINSIIFVLFMLNLAGSGSRLMLDSADLIEQGVEIGGNNPISYGLPIAFCIIAIYSHIRKINFVNTKYIPLLISLLFLALFLTTSRGSFLILIITLPIYFYLTGKISELIKLLIIFVFLSFTLTFLVSLFPDFKFAYEFLVDRTQSDAGLNQISHGRTEQWQSMLAYAETNFADLIFGFGPGMQVEAHEIISMSLSGSIDATFQGKKIAFHALPLQLISEIGLFGFCFFYFVAFRIFFYTLTVFRKTKFILPLLGFIGWFGAGLSVSSLDPFSGLFLGLSFIPIFNRINN
jgi:hypothetical protein